MSAHALRDRVFRANLALAESGLVLETFGNVSGADHDAGLMAIKPSGVPYRKLTLVDIVLVSIETGEVVDSALRPSSDTPTHLELYRAFRCGGIVHTHSKFTAAFAQAQLPIRCLNTTHADYFRGDVPVTRPMTEAEVVTDYERNTGLVIVETFRTLGLLARRGRGRARGESRPVRLVGRPGARRRGGPRARVPGRGQPRGANPQPGRAGAGPVPRGQALPAKTRRAGLLRPAPARFVIPSCLAQARLHRGGRGLHRRMPVRMTRLFLTAFIVLIAGAAGQAVPQDARTQDGSQALQQPYYGKKICGYPRPDGRARGGLGERVRGVHVHADQPRGVGRRHADEPLVRRRLRDPDQGRARHRRTRPARSATS